jgi:type I restriction enzyme R subunit
MSELLEALIQKQKEDAEDYAGYLRKLIELTKKVGTREAADGKAYPEWASTPARRAIMDFGWRPVDLVVDHEALHHRIQASKEHGWADAGAGRMKERALARELRKELPGVEEDSLAGFIELLKNNDEYR